MAAAIESSNPPPSVHQNGGIAAQRRAWLATHFLTNLIARAEKRKKMSESSIRIDFVSGRDQDCQVSQLVVRP